MLIPEIFLKSDTSSHVKPSRVSWNLKLKRSAGSQSPSVQVISCIAIGLRLGGSVCTDNMYPSYTWIVLLQVNQ
jgi:hypothetical protein